MNSLPSEMAKVLKIHGRIDILINNAGISYRGEVIDTKVDVDIKVMLINYFGQIALAKGISLYWNFSDLFDYFIIFKKLINGFKLFYHIWPNKILVTLCALVVYKEK